MEFKRYSQFAQNHSKNKLVSENVVTQAHGGCSLRVINYKYTVITCCIIL